MFKKRNNQVIKFERNMYDVSTDDNDVLFVRVSDAVTTKNAMFLVDQNHDALFIKSGGDCRFYKSGLYPVFDNKDEIKMWRKGASVEVIYVAKDTEITVLWGTKQMEYRDIVSNEVISTGLSGRCDIAIINPEQFFRKIVGVQKIFCREDFHDRFRVLISSEVREAFLNLITKEQLTYDKFETNAMRISTKIEEILSEKFSDLYGVKLSTLIIENFQTSDANKQKVEEPIAKLREEQEEIKKAAKYKEYLAELERLDDKQWEREKYLRQLEKDDNAAYYDVLKALSKRDEDLSLKNKNICSKCGHSCDADAAFCSKCGNKLCESSVICPHCKKANLHDATFCISCGEKLK